MAFTGVLPIIFVGLIFLGLGYVVARRNRWAAALPVLMGLGFILYAFSVFSNASKRTVGQQDYYFLLNELRKDELTDYLWKNTDEELNLYFASLCSQALYRVAKNNPGEVERVTPFLREFAEWVSDSRNFPQWNRKSRWPEEAFFLAHAAIIIGHYQELTEDETFSAQWQSIGEYLGRAMRAARYKNLVSRPEDDLMRPADNAALLYALSIYDAYHATEYTPLIGEKWLLYLDQELKTADSHLPCSAFTNTSTCRLEATASALGMCVGYLGAAGFTDRQQLYREWLHYFKSSSFSPLTLDTRSSMMTQSEDDPIFCDEASYPLPCEENLDAIAMWLASEFGGSYTYARLISEEMLDKNARASDRLVGMRPVKKISPLIEVSLRVMAQYDL
jgi:hypothetical protein